VELAAGDHIGEFDCPTPGSTIYARCWRASSETPGVISRSTTRRFSGEPWHEQGHSAFHPDNIIIDSRKANLIVIIEKATGKIVWRAGPYGDLYANYEERIHNNRLPRPLDQTPGSTAPT